MPLLDHLHPPLQPFHHWESFHSNWATRIADDLNSRLPGLTLVGAIEMISNPIL